MKLSVFYIFLLLSLSSFSQKMQEVEIAGVGIYPNPFNEQIFVKTENPIDKIEIFNETGMKILTFDEKNIIDANQLKKGTYTLKLYFKDQIIVRKVVKN